MNLIAVDIGNTNITAELFLNGSEASTGTIAGGKQSKLAALLGSYWGRIPVSAESRQGKRDGVIVVSSVRSAWTRALRRIVREDLGQKIQVIGRDIPLPMGLAVDEPKKVGTDRVVAAAAAYAVVEDAVVVADFGTATTIDLVDADGTFLGGVICPGLEIGAAWLKDATAQLPKVVVSRPQNPYGRNTTEAINCGLYYGAIGTIEEVIRRYAEKIGRWPQTVLTGGAAHLIKDDCPFIDSYVPNLVVKGIALAYKKYLEEKAL